MCNPLDHKREHLKDQPKCVQLTAEHNYDVSRTNAILETMYFMLLAEKIRTKQGIAGGEFLICLRRQKR
ncbi:MAG: hypothetical protein C5B44_04610 [Acidobacteria bacterium]|nr:MAG: hypothetical protein C5B44_04610 [Acidobacteriota bacterium]